MISPYFVYLRWEGVPGATGYQIVIDGVAVATAGQKARTTRVSVKDGKHTVQIVDLPARSAPQEIDLNYERT